jgi:hypothetical protein
MTCSSAPARRDETTALSGQPQSGNRGDNLSFQISGGDGMGRCIEDSFCDAQYALIDLSWSPYESVDLGIEVLFGEQEQEDG